MRRLLVPLLFLMTCATMALAQDRQGNNTAGDWRVSHYAGHGIWNTICDKRDEDGAVVQRCYIRWVDVYSHRPKFGGIFAFVTPQDDGFEVDFGQERGSLYGSNGFRIERNGEIVWRTQWLGCLTGFSCTFSGAAAENLLSEMRTGGDFRFTFRDPHGQYQRLSWPLEGFDAAWDDFLTQARSRNLIAAK